MPPKPHGFAAVTPEGEVQPKSFGPSRAAVEGYYGALWPHYRKLGYRIVPVTLTAAGPLRRAR